jgi:hypothetical protein
VRGPCRRAGIRRSRREIAIVDRNSGNGRAIAAQSPREQGLTASRAVATFFSGGMRSEKRRRSATAQTRDAAKRRTRQAFATVAIRRQRGERRPHSRAFRCARVVIVNGAEIIDIGVRL